MLAGLMKMIKKEEPLNSGDMLHLMEIVVVIFGLAFTIYKNAGQVPALKDAVTALEVRTTIVETNQSATKTELDDIRGAVNRIENLLMNRGNN